MTLDDAILLTAGKDMWSTAAVEDTPSMRMADGPMGIASGRVDERDVSILTPSGVALAASWDRAMVASVGALVGGEAKRQGVDLVLAPNLNLQRTPLAGRAFELFGEDPLLAGTLGVAWIDGLQSRHVGAVAKHLVCNDTETGRDGYDAIVDEQTLREIYLLPFEMAAKAGCAGILAAYNRVNGDHCSENHHLLTTVLRKDWGYDGFTVCDWFGSHSTAPSMNAGLDLEMPGPPRHYGVALRKAVENGDVAEHAVIAAADRVARTARRWSGGDAGAEPGDRDTLLMQAAAAGFVLLRNDDTLLPLVPGDAGTLAVIGPNAAAPCFQGGTFAKVSLRPDAVLPVDALRQRYGTERIVFAPGCDPAPRLPAMPASPTRDLGDGCTRGMTVEYFATHDFDAAPMGAETRDTNSLTWFGGMPGIGAFDKAGGVRASGRIVPEKSGVHRLHIGGTGSLRLTVDGREVLVAEQAVAPADIMGILKGGDSRSVEIDLKAGVPVDITAELRFQPARAQGLWYGLRAPDDAAALLAEAEDIAGQADVVLLVLGETADSGVESKDRDSTALPVEQQALARRVIAANPNVIVAINVAHAFDPAIADGAKALMVVWYPGEAFGPALAAVIAGDLEPSGRLPLTIAAREQDYPVWHAIPGDGKALPYSEGVAIGYRAFTDPAAPLPAFAFGAGIGYGAVRCTDVTAARLPDGAIVLTVDVANDAGRDTASVIQVYREDGALAGFVKAPVPAHGTTTAKCVIDPIALRRWQDGGWCAPEGPIKLKVGTASDCLPLTIQVG